MGQSINPFLIFGAETPEPPNEVYAYVDQVEPIDAGENDIRTLRLDCIGSDWFDSTRDTDRVWNMLPEAPLALIEADLPPALRNFRALGVEGNWFRLRFGNDGEIMATRYANLFGEGQQGTISDITLLDENTKAALEHHFSLDGVPDLNDRVEELIQRSSDLDFVNVLDVGQGNCNALWKDSAGALLYFDAGGGITSHTNTYPTNLKICTTYKPPVILSHWDKDHWVSGVRVPSLQNSPWIVPNQGPLSSGHAAFAQTLHAKGNLYVWPRNLPHKTFGRITIERCTGSGTNDTGLAMIVDGPSDKSPSPVLLTGDAEYASIPTVYGGQYSAFHAVVVPHHGGRASRTITSVKPDSTSSKRLVYSYGSPNHFGHPHYSTLQQHRVAGWRGSVTRSTPTANDSRPAHVLVAWDNRNYRTGCFGHPSCQPSQ